MVKKLKICFFICVFSIFVFCCDKNHGPIIGNLYNSKIIIECDNYDIDVVSKYNLDKKLIIYTRSKARPKFKAIKVYSIESNLLAEYSIDFLNAIRENAIKNDIEIGKNEFWVVSEKGLYLVPEDVDWKEYVDSQPPNKP